MTLQKRKPLLLLRSDFVCRERTADATSRAESFRMAAMPARAEFASARAAVTVRMCFTAIRPDVSGG